MKNLNILYSGNLRILVSFITLLFIFPISKSSSQDYVWPTDASKYLTSNFCEFRSNHFHSGIDIKTWGKNGYKVFAIDNGSLVRMKVSPYGYGKVLYIHHYDGRYSVYGHLLKFSSEIQKIIKKEQKNRNKFSVEMFFKEGQIPIKKGELIAYTGRSGTISPHLHFEIRDSNNSPINPNIYGFKIDDKFSPVVKSISFSPLDYNSIVNKDYKSLIVKANNLSNGKFIIPETVELWGNIGVGISAYDKDGNVSNIYETYFIEFFVDGKNVFKVKYDKFSFSETRGIYLDRDFRLMKRGFGRFNKLYRDVGNTLNFYGNYKTLEGVIRARLSEENGVGEGNHTFKIILGDASGNNSICSGRFNVKKPEEIELVENNENTYFTSSESLSSEQILFMNYDLYDNYLRLEIKSSENLISIPDIEVYNNGKFEVNLKTKHLKKNIYVSTYPLIGESVKYLRFLIRGKSTQGTNALEEYSLKLFPVSKSGGMFISEDRNCVVEFPEGTVYNKFWGRIVESNIENSTNVSKVYSVEPFDIPLKRRAVLSISCPENISNIEKIGIYGYSGNSWKYSYSKLKKSLSIFESNINEMKEFTLLRDTNPPAIYKITPKNRIKLRNRKPIITVKFEDKLSGIGGEDYITLKIDGKRVIFEYDPFLKNIIYIPDELLSYGLHRIEFEVKDYMNNIASKESSFTIIK